MRLINTESLEIHEFADARFAPSYAILSHCWGDKEVSFKDYTKGRNLGGAGYKKIVECCAFAKARGQKWLWIDTCCIDKRSSAELGEAINSMYQWYQEANECYAYLVDITSAPIGNYISLAQPLQDSRWFLRGWTLQELIAPARVIFLTSDWHEIGHKLKSSNENVGAIIEDATDLTDSVASITGIPRVILWNGDRIDQCSAAQRLSWMTLPASGDMARETSRVEDQSYCLFGLFGVNMSLLYGEGTHAFERLQIEILNRMGDESILIRNRPAYNFIPRNASSYWCAGGVSRANVHDRPPMTISDRWAKLYMTKGRPGVFQHRERKKSHVVRLNCTHSDERLLPSPCILFLEQLSCGHFVSTFATEQSFSYVVVPTVADLTYPYCERHLARIDQWVPLVSNDILLIHLDRTDLINCHNIQQQRPENIEFRLKDKTN